MQQVIATTTVACKAAIVDKCSQVFSRGATAALFAILTMSFTPGAWANNCSSKDAEEAQTAVDRIDSWAHLAQFRERFLRCDHGSVAEGSSEAVARLLVDHWADLSALTGIEANHPGVTAFALRHINSTLDTGDLRQIAYLATKQCRPADTKICTGLKAATRRALRSQR